MDKLINLLDPSVIDESLITSAFIICIVDKGIVLGYNNWRKQWEVPAGKRELGETIEKTAIREFLEETHHVITSPSLNKIAEISDENNQSRYRGIFLTKINQLEKFTKRPNDEMDALLLANLEELADLNIDQLDKAILQQFELDIT